MSSAEEAAQLLELFGIDHAGGLVSHSPIDGAAIGRVTVGDPERAAARAADAFESWRTVPAPRRGELVRLLGEEIREAKPLLAKMITLEAGKITAESLGEVQ
ncbi:MAG TPA: aldehyde dehydrogenase family protein, partial [Sphingomicrobium sp.]|nr:aldehyde dehydrogenase family protein [Sphingomicrobium sp.]